MNATIPRKFGPGEWNSKRHGNFRVSFRAFGGALVMSCLSGCMGGPPASEPAALESARNFSAQAETATAEGRHAEACDSYAKALGIYRSTDYGPGIVRALLNLAAVRLQAGDRNGARDCLRAAWRYEASLEASNPAEAKREGMIVLWAELAWLEARLDADEGRLGAAWSALARGHACGGRLSNDLKGRYAALEARLHLAAGEFARAEASACQSLAAYRVAGDEQGAADALRYRGASRIGSGKPNEALACFGSALEIDQRHARATKVKEDLLGMSHAAAACGDMPRARACADRAAKIAIEGAAGRKM